MLLLEPFCAVSVPLGLDLVLTVLNLGKGMCFLCLFCAFLCLAFRETIKTRMCFWIGEKSAHVFFFQVKKKHVCVFSRTVICDSCLAETVGCGASGSQ